MKLSIFSEEQVKEMNDKELINNIETAVSFDVPAGDMSEAVDELIRRYKKKAKIKW